MISNLEVSWVGEELRARWIGGEDPTVFVSASPDDAGTVIVPVESPGQIRVLGLPAGFRAYVHVLDLDGRWTMAGERLIRLDRATNAVDLGGAPSGEGRTVGWGRVFAADPIDGLDAAGRERLATLGIRTVADLRSGTASSGRPGWLDRAVRWELPGMGESEARQLAEVVALASDPDHHALLFHHAVGSDRAVVVAALLLSLVGVADADLPFFPDRPRLLAELRAAHGSVEGYALGPGGLRPEDLDRLRRALLAG